MLWQPLKTTKTDLFLLFLFFFSSHIITLKEPRFYTGQGMSSWNGHSAKRRKKRKPQLKAISKAAGDCCSRLPRRQRQKEPPHPQSWALQSSLSSHVRCVGEWRLWFLCLCRPVGFISGCTALLPDILLQRRHLLFSSRNLTSVCDQSLPVKRKKGILIRSCGCPWVCRGAPLPTVLELLIVLHVAFLYR